MVFCEQNTMEHRERDANSNHPICASSFTQRKKVL